MKKYNLKPGNHQFIPGSPAVHNNDNLTDEEAEWYLAQYPHIAGLFVGSPETRTTESPEEAASLKPKAKRKRILRRTGAPGTSITNSLNQSFTN